MAFEMSFDDVDPDKVGGSDRVHPGEYHCLIEAVDEEGENYSMVVDLQILRGTTPCQEGKAYQLKLKKDFGEWPQRKLTAFGIAARLFTADEMKKAKAERQSLNIDWTKAAGRSICLSLENSQDGKWTNLRFDNIWKPDDKRAAQIPLHAKALERDGIKLAANRPIDGVLSASAAGGKQQQQQKPAAAAAKSKPDVNTDDLGDCLGDAL